MAGGCQLLSMASCARPSFFSPESGLLTCGRATPTPCSGMGQVEASPHGCCQESTCACAQVHVTLEGAGASSPILLCPQAQESPCVVGTHTCLPIHAVACESAVVPVGEEDIDWGGLGMFHW